jgi:hypothetical protein
LAADLDETRPRHKDRRSDDREHRWRALNDAHVVASLQRHDQQSPHDIRAAC